MPERRYVGKAAPRGSILGGRGSDLGTVAGVILITPPAIDPVGHPDARSGRQVIYGVVIVAILLLY